MQITRFCSARATQLDRPNIRCQRSRTAFARINHHQLETHRRKKHPRFSLLHRKPTAAPSPTHQTTAFPTLSTYGWILFPPGTPIVVTLNPNLVVGPIGSVHLKSQYAVCAFRTPARQVFSRSTLSATPSTVVVGDMGAVMRMNWLVGRTMGISLSRVPWARPGGWMSGIGWGLGMVV